MSVKCLLFWDSEKSLYSKHTAIVVSLETLVRNWVDEDVLFNTNIWQTCCNTDLTFCVMIAKEQGFFLRAKKLQTLNGQPGQLIFYTFNTCLN